MKPRILISGSASGAGNYAAAVEAAGGEAVVAYCPAADLTCDGLLLCGGGDVEPHRYGQENTFSTDMDPERDEAELALIEAFAGAGKPILGVCRGHQILNVAFGGDLIQDIGDPLHLFHTRGDLPDDRIHPVWNAPDGFLYPVFGACFPVNSSHHQAVGRVGEGLRAVAWSECGLVEAMEHTSLPIRCVQWHPERTTGKLSRPDAADGAPLFRWLVDAASGN